MFMFHCLVRKIGVKLFRFHRDLILFDYQTKKFLLHTSIGLSTVVQSRITRQDRPGLSLWISETQTSWIQRHCHCWSFTRIRTCMVLVWRVVYSVSKICRNGLSLWEHEWPQNISLAMLLLDSHTEEVMRSLKSLTSSSS